MEKGIKITLAAARVNAGLTQSEVADKMKINKQTLVNWEKGRTNPNPASFHFLCNLYGISEDYIFLKSIQL